MLDDGRDGFVRIGDRRDRVADLGQDAADQFAGRGVCLDEQDSAGGQEASAIWAGVGGLLAERIPWKPRPIASQGSASYLGARVPARPLRA